MLSTEQIGFYQDNGYLMIEDAVSPVQLLALQETTHALIEKSRDVTENNAIYDLDDGHTALQPKLTRIKLPHTLDPVYWNVLTSDPITAMLISLLGADIRLHTSKLNTKAPGGGAAVEWHQDWAFYPHTNDDMLAIAIMLDDVDRDNGPLMVIPGSHKGAVLSHTANGIFCGAINPNDAGFDKSKAVALTGKAGSMSIHHVRTLHGSAPNYSDRARMLLFFEAGASDAWPLNGIASPVTGLTQQDYWTFLNERMVCGEQRLEPRLEKVPVTMPLPPAPDNTSICKVQQSGGAGSAFEGSCI